MAGSYAAVLRRNLLRALHRGDPVAARQALERLQEEEPFARATRILELEVALAGHRDDEAEALAGQLLELFPDSPRVHYLAGRLAYRRKDYPRAAGHLAESDRLHPHGRTRHLLGKTLTQAGRLAEAEGILLDLVAERPQVRRDLAWLYERRGRFEAALEQLRRHLERFPQDDFAREHRLRLEARLADPDVVAEDVAGLEAVGEEVPAELLLVHCEELLAAGREAEVRRLIAGRESLPPRLAYRLGWSCYQAGRDQLAFELFRRELAGHLGDIKFLNAFEAAARRCGLTDEVAELYAAHAPEEPRLYGRIKRLRRG